MSSYIRLGKTTPCYVTSIHALEHHDGGYQSIRDFVSTME